MELRGGKRSAAPATAPTPPVKDEPKDEPTATARRRSSRLASAQPPPPSLPARANPQPKPAPKSPATPPPQTPRSRPPKIVVARTRDEASPPPKGRFSRPAIAVRAEQLAEQMASSREASGTPVAGAGQPETGNWVVDTLAERVRKSRQPVVLTEEESGEAGREELEELGRRLVEERSHRAMGEWDGVRSGKVEGEARRRFEALLEGGEAEGDGEVVLDEGMEMEVEGVGDEREPDAGVVDMDVDFEDSGFRSMTDGADDDRGGDSMPSSAMDDIDMESLILVDEPQATTPSPHFPTQAPPLKADNTANDQLSAPNFGNLSQTQEPTPPREVDTPPDEKPENKSTGSDRVLRSHRKACETPIKSEPCPETKPLAEKTEKDGNGRVLRSRNKPPGRGGGPRR